MQVIQKVRFQSEQWLCQLSRLPLAVLRCFCRRDYLWNSAARQFLHLMFDVVVVLLLLNANQAGFTIFPEVSKGCNPR